MRLQRQRSQECMLASIAMIYDLDLASVRQEACQRAGVIAWEETLGTPRFAKGVKPWVKGEFCYVSFARSNPIGADQDPIPPTGRGLVLISWGLGGHAMAYENGRIFDPKHQAENGETWEEYSTRKQGLIRGVAVIPKEQLKGD